MRAILTYHSIDPSRSPISTDPTVFREHVRWLTSGIVQVVRLEEIAALPRETDAVALTFDDGFLNFATHAVPLLREHGLPATVFVVSGHVGGTNAWHAPGDRTVPVLPLLDWDALGAATEQGVAIGAHGVTHRRLPRLAADERDLELAQCADEIASHTGVSPRAFAYPFGSVDAASARSVAARYAWGCSTVLRPLGEREHPALLPRIDMYYFGNPGRLGAWGSVRFRSYLDLRARARDLRERVASVTSRQ